MAKLWVTACTEVGSAADTSDTVLAELICSTQLTRIEQLNTQYIYLVGEQRLIWELFRLAILMRQFSLDLSLSIENRHKFSIFSPVKLVVHFRSI